jgi:hypothetical protein
MVSAVDSTVTTIASSFTSPISNPRGIYGNANFLIVACGVAAVGLKGAVRKIDLTSSAHSVSTVVTCASGLSQCINEYTANPTEQRDGIRWAIEEPFGTFIDGNILYFADSTKHVILRTDLSVAWFPTSVIYGTWNTLGENGLNNPYYLYVTSQGLTKYLYVTENKGHRVLRLTLSSTGSSVTAPFEVLAGVYSGGSTTGGPTGIWVDEDKQIVYYADPTAKKILTIDVSVDHTSDTVTFPSSSLLNSPTAIFFREYPTITYRKDSILYVADIGSARILRLGRPPTTYPEGTHRHLRRN